MADAYLEIYRKLSRSLHARAEEAGIFTHKSGRGEGRELLFTEFLRERLGAAFAVSKAEVVDSHGETSGELDAVVYDDTVSASLHDQGTRRVLRAEAVAVVIEVRTRLDASSKDDEMKKVETGIGKLRRVFRPLPFLELIFRENEEARKESEQLFKDGLPALLWHQDVPRVVHAFFGFDGPKLEAIGPFADAAHADIVCVNGKYTLTKEKPGFAPQTAGPSALLVVEGEDALGAFAEQIDQVLQRFRDARQYVTPGANYYVRARRRSPRSERPNGKRPSPRPHRSRSRAGTNRAPCAQRQRIRSAFARSFASARASSMRNRSRDTPTTSATSSSAAPPRSATSRAHDSSSSASSRPG